MKANDSEVINDNADVRRNTAQVTELDTYKIMMSNLGLEIPDTYVDEGLNGAPSIDSELERDIKLLEKYKLLQPKSGVTEWHDTLTGKGTVKLVLEDGNTICFDMPEPDLFNRFSINIWRFTRC